MREWSRTNVSNIQDPSALRGIITSMDVQLRELSTAVKLLGGGRVAVADNLPLSVSGGGSTPHKLLDGIFNSDTVAATASAGSLIVGTSGSAWDKLPLGTSGYILTANSTGCGWAAASTPAHTLLSATHSDSVAATAVAYDMIMANNTPKWDRLAVGVAGDVLMVTTVSSVTKPRWVSLTSAVLPNRTRSIFLPPAVWATSTTSAAGTAPNNIQTKTMGAVSTTSITTTIILPADYQALGAVYLHYSNAGTSTNSVVWNLYSLSLAPGVLTTTTADGSTTDLITTPDATTDNLSSDAVGGQFMTLGGADYAPLSMLRLSLNRAPTHANDTNGSAMNFLGLEISYTADM